MTCQPAPPTFRLLDAVVGWDPLDTCRISGLDDPEGLRLARTDQRPGLQRHDVLPWFPPPRLAPTCGPCGWYLAAPRAGLLRRDACGPGWAPVWPADCRPERPARPTAVGARGNGFAVAGDGVLVLWRRDGAQHAGAVHIDVAAISYASWGELLVALRGSDALLRVDPSGFVRGRVLTGLNLGRRGRIAGITTGDGCTIWLLSWDAAHGWRLWRGIRGEPGFVPATVAELSVSARASTLTAVGRAGFCLRETGPDGDLVERCFTWEGAPLDPAALRRTPQLAENGQLLTRAADSGIPRCRWHRVQVDADVPAGTRVDVAVATSDDPTPAGPVPRPGDWFGCPAGPPHPQDWQEVPSGSLDLLVDQPPGRYLYVRLRLTGDGTATPVVRRVQLDFPRVTSAELLPAVFRRDPAADDFTERFLSLFDASVAELDRAVERYPALLDPEGVPDEVLPWLAGLLGLAFDPEWDAATRRALIAAAPQLYRRRGTPWALAEAIRLVFGIDPVVVEHGPLRAWATLGRDARLRTGRLFGRSAARFRVGTSALSRAPLRSFGNPDADPLTAAAYRVTVLLGRPAAGGQADLTAVRGLAARQAPAHIAVEVRGRGPAFVVGTWSTVGVDTALTPLPAPVLGAAARGGRPVRLGRDSVVWPAHGRREGVQVGVRSAVGLQTVAR